jgi:hypothetical protein
MEKYNREFWIKRGESFKQKEGFVCLGRGDLGRNLSNYFEYEEIYREREGESFYKGWSGNSPESTYYVTQELFDSVYPETQKEMKDPFRFTIKILSPEHCKLVQEVAFQHGFSWNSGDTRPLYVDENHPRYISFGEDKPFKMRSVISNCDLEGVGIDHFFTLPKSFKGTLGGYDVIANGDSVQIGCKAFPLSEIKALDLSFGTLGGSPVEPSADALVFWNGYKFSLREVSQLLKELKKL